MTLDLEYDENTLVQVDCTYRDNSFDHAFGTRRISGYELDDLKIFVYSEHFDWLDVTDKIRHVQLDFYLNWAQEKLDERNAS